MAIGGPDSRESVLKAQRAEAQRKEKRFRNFCLEHPEIPLNLRPQTFAAFEEFCRDWKDQVKDLPKHLGQKILWRMKEAHDQRIRTKALVVARWCGGHGASQAATYGTLDETESWNHDFQSGALAIEDTRGYGPGKLLDPEDRTTIRYQGQPGFLSLEDRTTIHYLGQPVFFQRDGIPTTFIPGPWTQQLDKLYIKAEEEKVRVTRALQARVAKGKKGQIKELYKNWGLEESK